MRFAEELIAQLPRWLGAQRWFAAKDWPVRSVTIADDTPLLTDRDPLLDLLVLAVEFDEADAGAPHYYQLLLGRRREVQPELEHAVIGSADGMIAYDGLWDHDVSAWLLEAIRSGHTAGAVRFRPEPDAELADPGPGRVLGVEQSNTSVAWGERSILKLFRRIIPGLNPDLELHRALRSAGSEQVATLQGAIEGVVGGEPTTLGMLQDFAANSADGWAMALTSMRDLLAEGDLRADEVGGDFAGEAHRLGEAVADVHRELAGALATGECDPADLAATWHQRLGAAVTEVPRLGEHIEGIRAVYDTVAALGAPIPIQRVHGDLHLGQTLRTPYGWLIIDFEGEPSAPLAERRRPDSALRDVAGMLRSFDYAAFHSLLQWAPEEYDEEPAEHEPPHLYHAKEWAERNRSAFCDGYAAHAGADPREHGALLRAFELDKAVYEVVYETRSRPTWAPIPLGSIARLTASATAAEG
ncbi:aminoglycoside phosphotransferase [Pseudonocardia hispaniensis]|uniref:Maltokinase n=1 Tax=Pseudonocardia hispaniensis TaxID=904933 RepID=A0ABW1J6W3_9PSEU